MQNESQPSPETAAAPEPVSPQRRAIAPVWHTMLIVAMILFASLAGSPGQGRLSGGSRIVLYGGTFVFELILVLLIWFWIRRAGVSMRELIGGRWDTVEGFLLDVAVAVGFCILAAMAVAGVRAALGTLDLHHLDKQLEETKRTLGPLIPRSKLEAGLFVALSVSAGLFEEIVFRGYLQRQIGALAGNIWVGIVASAVILVAIGVYGALFGILAYFRKSLRPGMMAHALQDAYSGLALFFLAR
jgi:membrane protease YdiL (CAAX protease family)